MVAQLDPDHRAPLKCVKPLARKSRRFRFDIRKRPQHRAGRAEDRGIVPAPPERRSPAGEQSVAVTGFHRLRARWSSPSLGAPF
jgi:hypothetical protein